MSGLPDGWSKASVADVVALHDNRRVPLNAKQRETMRGSYPYYGANGLVDHVKDYLFDGEYTLLAEDGGYFDDPKRGVAYEVSGKFWVNNHAHILEPLAGMSNRFLRHALNAVDWMPHVGGSTRLKLTQKGLQKAQVALPPLLEHRRIVAKIDSLAAKSQRARDELDRVPHLVEKYKRAILAAAFRGDLTADWRATHRVVALSGERDYSELALDDEERGQWSTEMLADGWEWRPFNSVFEDVTDSTRKLQQNAYTANGKYPVIDQGEALIGGYTDKKELLHQSEPPFVIFGDHTRCVKFFTAPFVQGADGVKVLKTVADVEPLFGRYALSAVVLPDKGYSRHMKFLRATSFPVTGREEQQEIVRRIETTFAWIDGLGSEADNARNLIEYLDHAVIVQAFHGELVPQDPSDEPASVLLERIQTERADAATTASKRARSKKR